MAFRKLVGSYKDYNLSTHILEDGYLAVDVDSGSLRLGDGSTAGGIEEIQLRLQYQYQMVEF